MAAQNGHSVPLPPPLDLPFLSEVTPSLKSGAEFLIQGCNGYLDATGHIAYVEIHPIGHYLKDSAASAIATLEPGDARTSLEVARQIGHSAVTAGDNLLSVASRLSTTARTLQSIGLEILRAARVNEEVVITSTLVASGVQYEGFMQAIGEEVKPLREAFEIAKTAAESSLEEVEDLLP